MRAYLLALLLMCSGVSQAAVVPVTPMQNAASGVIQSKMQSRGFAANDPRYGATLNAVSATAGTVAGTAAVVVLGAVSAPAWLTVAASAGLATVVTLAVGGLVEWAFGDSPDYTVTGPLAPAPDGVYFHWTSGSPSAAYFPYTQAGFDSACAVLYTVPWNGTYSRRSDGWIGSPTNRCNVATTYNNWSTFFNEQLSIGTISSVSSLPAGAVVATATTSPATLPDAISALPASELAKPASHELVAAMINELVRDAASTSGYAGVPMPLDDPVTAADVAAWAAANPASYPTLGDVVAPQPAANDPWKLPVSSEPVSTQDPALNPGTSVNPSTEPLANLGADPGIGSPTLEATPTASAILAPVLGLMPSLRTFVMPSHSAVCPAPSGDFLGTPFTLDGHCALLEGVRPTLSLVMAAVWLMVSTLVVLRA